jgi:hypothetical protein
MFQIENGRPGVGSRHGRSDCDSSNNGANVIPLLQKLNSRQQAFDRLTVGLVLAQFRAGTLPEGILVALLANARLAP